MSTIGMLVVMLAIFYFLLIRPENKKKKELAKMRSELTIGDEVTTIGGIIGTICAVNEALADAPETLNSDPYGAWIIKVEGIGGTEELLDAAAYEAHCAEEG